MIFRILRKRREAREAAQFRDHVATATAIFRRLPGTAMLNCFGTMIECRDDVSPAAARAFAHGVDRWADEKERA